MKANNKDNYRGITGVLSRKFSVSQGTEQGRIFAPFMYKVYTISLLCELSDHCFSINGLRLPSPSFADAISLLALHPSFLQTFMKICFDYGVRWRYEFDLNIESTSVLPSICDTLCNYNLFTYFETWFHNSVFPCYEEWKSIVYRGVRNSEMIKWTWYSVSHPNLNLAKACIDNIPPQQCWSLTDQYPDLVRHLHVQVRLIG